MRQKGMTWLLIGLVTVCGWFCVERTVQAEQEGETKQEETGAEEDDEEAPEFGEVRCRLTVLRRNRYRCWPG